jgi:hypothetical protein
LGPELLADLAVAAVATVVGLFIGTVGVGGVLMISFLALFGGLGIHEAAATSLFSFLFTGMLGTWLFHRRGTIAWRLTLPVCAGALVFGYAGAFAAARVDARPLAILIALVILAAGAYIFMPARQESHYRDGRGWREQLLLGGVGAASGFGSGLSGAGGPVFSVPLMVILRYAPLAAVGTSQVLQIVAAASGSIGNAQRGFIDWRLAALVSAFELLGVMLGVRLAHAVSQVVLRRLAGVFCLIVGGLMLARSL